MKPKAMIIAYLLGSVIIWTTFQAAPLSAQPEPGNLSSARTTALPQQNDARSALVQGRQFLKRGNAEQALGPLEQALKLFAQAGNHRGEAEASDALGDLYSRQGQYAVALDYYQKAHRSFSASREAYNANLMLAKIGDMYYRQNKIAEARAAYSQMSVRKPDLNPLNTARAAQSKVGKAKGIFGRARSIATGTPSTSTSTQAASVGTEAANEAKRPRDLYRQFIIYSIHELGMGRVDYFNNQLGSARTHFENALGAAGGDLPVIGKLGQTRRFRIAARTSLGDIALSEGRYAEAIKFYTEVAEGARRDNHPDLIWPAQRGTGRAHLMQSMQEKDQQRAAKEKDEAINSYREALQTIETIRAGSLSADEARSTFLATTKDVFDEALSVLAERALQPPASPGTPLRGDALNDAAEAYRIMEQSRARSLLDMLGEVGANITEGVPADLLRRKQENLDRQQEIAQELTGVGAASETSTKSNEELEAELNQLSTEYDSIENQIRAASPRYAALTLPAPLTLAEVQQQVLDDRTALLEYSLGNNSSYLWAVTQNGVMLYKLPPRSTIDRQVLDLRTQIIPPNARTPILGINIANSQAQRGLGVGARTPENAAAFATSSNALYKTAVEPAASTIGDKRLLVVADGSLNYIPFEALVTSGGGDYSALPYLVKAHEIVYAPSASVIAVTRRQKAVPSGNNVLLVADPVFSPDDPRALRSAAKPSDEGADTRGLGLASALTDVAGAPANPSATKGLRLARLNGTRVEAEQIAQLARASGRQAEVWTDFNASEESLQTHDVKRYRVMHIATHGLLNAERPQFTGLVLSLVGNKRSEDGFLRTDEIFNLNLGARLVMLSACETGLGKEKRGEGVIGLTRAFMYAGAPTVGVSLWSVADRSTAELMTDFYKRLLAKQALSPGAALRAAQTAMIAGKRYSDPFYWAPFVLVGEWRQ